MLHAVIIITASGLILFQKEFALLPSSSAAPSSIPLSSASHSSPSYLSLSSKSGQLAGIITAVINFSLSRLGGQVSYIECDHVGVALHVHPASKVTCAVFHQVQDGEDFGRLVARELLQSFANVSAAALHRILASLRPLDAAAFPVLTELLCCVWSCAAFLSAVWQTYRSQLSTTVPRSDMFSSFTSKISGIISSCLRPVMDSLACQPGVLLVLCAQSDGFGYGHLDDASAASLSPNPTHHLRERLIVAQPLGATSPTVHSHSHSVVAPALDRTHSDDYRSLKKKAHSMFDSVRVQDQYAVLSAHDALLSLASELMSLHHDVASTVRMKGPEQSIFMHRWQEQRNTFIVVYHSHLAHQLLPAITQTQHLLHKGMLQLRRTSSCVMPRRCLHMPSPLLLLSSTVPVGAFIVVLVMASNLKS